MMQRKLTNSTRPSYEQRKGALIAASREGWEASNITTTFVAASVTEATPAKIVEIFNTGKYSAAPCKRVSSWDG
jgi:hypothetical protein